MSIKHNLVLNSKAHIIGADRHRSQVFPQDCTIIICHPRLELRSPSPARREINTSNRSKIMKKIFVIIGTRPDAIKMAPVYLTLQYKNNLDLKLISTGQHKDLLTSAFQTFNLNPDINFDVMRPAQSLSKLTQSILHNMENLFESDKPDLVLTHGDTVTCYAASLACFYNHIPIFHVEAGLRSHNILSPYPEEFYRKSVALIASHHYVPTTRAKQNLLTEKIDKNKITIIGHTIHEAINHVNFQDVFVDFYDQKYNKKILVTLHRREKDKNNLYAILNTIKNIALKEPRWMFIYPVHPSLYLKQISKEIFNNIDNIILTDPLEYKKFLRVLCDADLILTDSGGVQEEAAYLEKKVFVLRDFVERINGIDEKYAKIIGMSSENLEYEVIKYLKNQKNTHVSKTHNKKLTKIPSEIIASHLLSKIV